MPMRLVVMLHMRRSATAGEAARVNAPSASANSVVRARQRGSADEDDAAIIHVGAGWSGGEEIAQAFEETRRVVVGEDWPDIKSRRLRPHECRLVDERAGGIARVAAAAVGAIGVGRK